MAKRSNQHITIGFGFVLAAVVIAAAVFIGMKLGPGSQAKGPAAMASATAAASAAATVGNQAVAASETATAQPSTSQSIARDGQGQPQALSFNAIGPNVSKEAGYVCDVERWVLIGADNDPNGNHLLWQGENGDDREFSYQWDGHQIRLTEIATGKQLSFPMVHLDGGDWLMNGKRLQECAG